VERKREGGNGGRKGEGAEGRGLPPPPRKNIYIVLEAPVVCVCQCTCWTRDVKTLHSTGTHTASLLTTRAAASAADVCVA